MTQYPLPPRSSIALTFQALCETYTIERVGYLQEKLTFLVDITMVRSKRFSREDLLFAEKLVKNGTFLLGQYSSASPQEKALIIGAVRYLLLHGDEASDHLPKHGLADDALVINHVLEILGHQERCISR